MADLHADQRAKRLLHLDKKIISVSSSEQLPAM